MEAAMVSFALMPRNRLHVLRGGVRQDLNAFNYCRGMDD